MYCVSRPKFKCIMIIWRNRTILIYLFNTYVKSKSFVNWLFIFWNTGSWAVACALLARDSDAALENVVLTLETFSIPTPNVLTSFLTKFKVCGVIVASVTAIK